MSSKLSPHFSLHEFLRSDTATRMGREITAPDWVIENLRDLCINVMEPARARIRTVGGANIRIIITSGYRPEWLNKKIGGSKTSDHCHGRACDWVLSGAPENFDLFRACQEITKLSLPFDQLIYEGRWIHTGWRADPRGEIMTATFTRGRFGRVKTKYQKGLTRDV